MNSIWHSIKYDGKLNDLTDNFIECFGDDIINEDNINQLSFKMQDRIFKMTNGKFGKLLDIKINK